MERESISDLFSFQRLTDGVRNQRGRHISADLPRKDGLSTQIQYSAHVQHAARNRDVGDVRYPELIGLRLIEVPIQQIGIPVDGLLITGIRPAAANDGSIPNSV